MKLTQNRRWALLLFSFALILMVTLEHMLYTSGEYALKKKVDVALKEAVAGELDKEFQRLGLDQMTKGIFDNQRDSFQLMDENGVSFIKVDKSINKLRATDNLTQRFEQTLLGKMGNIPLDSVYHLWNELLKRERIVSDQALRLRISTSKDSVIVVIGDSTLCTSKYKKASSVYAGISNEIEIEPFIRYSYFTVLRNSSVGYVAGAEFLFIIAILLYALVTLRKSKAENEKVEDSPSDNRRIRIGNLTYDYDLNNFYVNGEYWQVRPQFIKLYLLFFKAPDHCITKSEIAVKLWGEKDIDVEDRYRRLLSDFRKNLNDTGLTLEIVSKGDTLCLKAKSPLFIEENHL